jgi:hypothetical protein
MAATATPIIKKDPVVQHPAGFQWVTIQAGAHDVFVGDSLVSATNGVKVAAGLSKDFSTPQGYTEDLNGWFLFGTAADVVVVLVIQ